MPHLMAVVGRVKQSGGGVGGEEEAGLDRRHTMPTVNGDGVLVGSGNSVGRQKWKKLKLLTKGMGS